MFRGYATAGALLHATRNPAGFDYLRLVLSFGVLAFHCILVTQGDTARKSSGRPIGGLCRLQFCRCFSR